MQPQKYLKDVNTSDLKLIFGALVLSCMFWFVVLYLLTPQHYLLYENECYQQDIGFHILCRQIVSLL